MEVKFLDLKKQYNQIEDEVKDVFNSVIQDSSFIGGKYVKSFENDFKKYLGVNYCIGVGNGTDALEIAIESLDLPKNSEILVPANSFISSAEAVSRQGHKIRFIDCNLDTYSISVDDLKKKISFKTRAIIVVHLYGTPCSEFSEILQISKNNKIYIIEDCAQAHGAKYNDKMVGSIGDIACFSFYPGKNLGAYGDAGAIVTNNQTLARKCRMISNHGRIDKYDHLFEGRNSRLDGIQAGILSVKLKFLDGWTSRRIEIANYYKARLVNVGDLILPYSNKKNYNVYHLFVIRTKERIRLKEFLKENSIQCGIHYPTSLPKLKAFSYLNQNNTTINSNEIDSNLLSLPIGEHITDKQMKYVVDKIITFYKDNPL